ncbi:pyridoxal-dependent decarboxylase [Nocardia sp. NPDC005978]|uniref:pyridoxal-dependent decarboxylase n=1 Tax=Nocardia sp. NPDC005978 TaxID=3156725 RepID=UPI0033A80BD6
MQSRLRIGRFPSSENELLEHLDAIIDESRVDDRYTLGPSVNRNVSFSHLSALLNAFPCHTGDLGVSGRPPTLSMAMELAVVMYLAELSNGDPDSTFGYITSGVREANQFGIDRGCTILPDARVYCSEAADSSIAACARLMRRELVLVECDASGAMDMRHLSQLCRTADGEGAVVVATVGTPLEGAVDDVAAIGAAAMGAGNVHIHLDATIGGLIAPFTSDRSRWGFAHSNVGSIALSPHTVLGLPMQCAVALCRTDVLDADASGFAGSSDATISGSRSGSPGVLLWYALARSGTAGLARNAWRALDTAAYAADSLALLGLDPVVHGSSIVVSFDRPAEWICQRYHLTTAGSRAAVTTVGHVTKDLIDEFCRTIADDLAQHMT